MKLTDAQMRAIELMIEQQERLSSLIENRRLKGIRADITVREFFESDSRGAMFERLVLDKIGALLAVGSTEDLNLTVQL